MTEQENRTLKKLVQQIEKFGAALEDMGDRIERVERGLLGDSDYGIVGLVDDHEDLKDEVIQLKTQVQGMSMSHNLLSKLPLLGALLLGFVGTGGDIGMLFRLMEGILR